MSSNKWPSKTQELAWFLKQLWHYICHTPVARCMMLHDIASNCISLGIKRYYILYDRIVSIIWCLLMLWYVYTSTHLHAYMSGMVPKHCEVQATFRVNLGASIGSNPPTPRDAGYPNLNLHVTLESWIRSKSLKPKPSFAWIRFRTKLRMALAMNQKSIFRQDDDILKLTEKSMKFLRFFLPGWDKKTVTVTSNNKQQTTTTTKIKQ